MRVPIGISFDPPQQFMERLQLVPGTAARH
jgi:hypothetical protein